MWICVVGIIKIVLRKTHEDGVTLKTGMPFRMHVRLINALNNNFNHYIAHIITIHYNYFFRTQNYLKNFDGIPHF